MIVLGIFGSPREGGNSDLLLETVINEVESSGIAVMRIYVRKLKISPCIECGACESTGKCAIEDDMQAIYGLVDKADAIVISTPIFFYHVPAQLKCLIDRAQALWARRYKLRCKATQSRYNRKGYMIAVGATKGERLFDGIRLTIKYFFDAVGAEYVGELLVRGVEGKGSVLNHPDAIEEAKKLGRKITADLTTSS